MSTIQRSNTSKPCAACGRPLGAVLFWNGSLGPYCSGLCLAELSRAEECSARDALAFVRAIAASTQPQAEWIDKARAIIGVAPSREQERSE